MIIRIFILLILVTSGINRSYSQVPSIQWQKCYGGSLGDNAYDIKQTTDGGYICCGQSTSINGDVSAHIGGIDFWVVKLDAAGTIVWERSLGGTGDDVAQSISQTADGGYIVVGSSNSNDVQVSGNHGGDNDICVFRLNAAGDIIWQKSLGGSLRDIANSVQQAPDGGFILAGESNSIDGDVTGNHGEADYWIVKLTSTGSLSWQKCLGGSSIDRANSIQNTTDGGFVVTGTASSIDGNVTNGWVHGGFLGWTCKLSSTGIIEWEKSYGTRANGIDVSKSICQTSDGGYAVTGVCGGNNGDVTGYQGGGDYWVIKLNTTGDLVWQKAVGGPISDEPQCIRQTLDGGYIVVGRTSSSSGDVTGNHGNFDTWLVKLSSSGSLEWQKALGGNSGEKGYSVAQTSDQGFVIANYALSNNNGDVGANHGQFDFWIVKLTPEALPITLMDFNAIQKANDVSCAWKTSFEQNGSHFDIERSYDAINFSVAGKVIANGNSSISMNYTFTDQGVAKIGKEYLYYRLKMVDIDGSFKYSSVVKITIQNTSSFIIYPNPLSETSAIFLNSKINEKALICIYDDAGLKVYEQRILIVKGNNSFPLNLNYLPAGGFTVIVKGISKYTARVIKIN